MCVCFWVVKAAKDNLTEDARFKDIHLPPSSSSSSSSCSDGKCTACAYMKYLGMCAGYTKDLGFPDMADDLNAAAHRLQDMTHNTQDCDPGVLENPLTVFKKKRLVLRVLWSLQEWLQGWLEDYTSRRGNNRKDPGGHSAHSKGRV